VTKRYARYALAVIAIANFLSYLDRQLVSALERPISDAVHGLDLNAAEFGLLWTLFTIGYMVCSPFIGFASDRYSRPRIFAACIFVWSLATISSGMAQAKWILYVSRVFIGLGEAGCLIVGSSLISDYFSKETRGRALSIFYLGLPLGGTFAFILAGLLINVVSWRVLFYMAGIPGFALSVFIWLLTEPPRGGADEAAGGHAPVRAAPREYLQLFRTPSLLFIILAQAFAMVILAPLVHFGVKFFETARGMTANEARIALGVIALVAGAAGNSVSGLLGDRLARRSRGAYAAMAGVSYLAGFPCLLGGFLFESRWLFLPAVTLGAFCIFLCMPAVNTQIANVTRPNQRAMAWALAVFILHLLGDTLSPPLFGGIEIALSGGVKDDPAARQTAFLWFATALVPAALCCFLSARTTARDEARAASPAP
jgi:MFS family permease